MAESPVPKSPRPYDPVAEAKRRERYQQSRRTRRLGGARLPEQIFKAGETIVDFDDDMETAYVILIGRADVYIRVRHKDDEIERDKPIFEITEGDLINAELLTHDGVESGGTSLVRIVAHTEMTLIPVTIHEITDPSVHENQRRARLDFVLDALSSALLKSEQARVVHRLDEEARDETVDAERDKRGAAEVARVKANLRISELEAANTALTAKNIELGEALEESEGWVETTDEKGIRSWRPPPPPTKKPLDSG